MSSPHRLTTWGALAGRATALIRAIRRLSDNQRRLTPAKQADADAAVREMLQNGVIEPPDSPWSSPVVLVGKKDGGGSAWITIV